MSVRPVPAGDAGTTPFIAKSPYRPKDVADCPHVGKYCVRHGAEILCLSCNATRPCTELEMLRQAAEEEFVAPRLIDAAELAEQDPVGEIAEAMWTEPVQ